MYFHLRDHIYAAQFKDDFIVLDTKKDKYIICSEKFSQILLSLSESREIYNQAALSIHNSLYNIIETKQTPYPFYIDRNLNSNGVENLDWNLPTSEISFSMDVAKALKTLLKVKVYMKFMGLYATIQLIKNSKSTKVEYKIPSLEDLTKLSNIVSQAYFISPVKIRCLEWCTTFVLMALKRKWKCNIEVGVQNHPFISHAWVECGDTVVMDDKNLRKKLAIILNEPFKKLKK